MKLLKIIIGMMLLILFSITTVSAGDFSYGGEWSENSSIVTGLTDVGQQSYPDIFYMDGKWNAVVGEYNNYINGFDYDGETWSANSSFDITLVVTIKVAPAIVYHDDTWKLIIGADDEWFGYQWNGTAFELNASLITGLPTRNDIRGKPDLIVVGDELRIYFTERISSGNYEFRCYVWNGASWINTASLATGVVKPTATYTPRVFNDSGTLNLIMFGNFEEPIFGYEWNGTAWNSKSDIINGLSSTSSEYGFGIFNDSGIWKIIKGDSDGLYTGYEWEPNPEEPSTPVNLINNTGNFWVEFEWEDGTGYFYTDSFNISQNGSWTNGTRVFSINTVLSPHGSSEIIVYSYNETLDALSDNVTDNVTIPNNPITIININDYSGGVGETVNVNANSIDLDSDTPTFSCNRTDLFVDFNTATGVGSWTSNETGIIPVNFGVSDGYGSTDNVTMIITLTIYHPIIISIDNNISTNIYPKLSKDQTISFTATTQYVYSNSQWNWYVNGVNQSHNYDNITLSWSAIGHKSVTLYIVNVYGNVSDNATAYPLVTRAMATGADVKALYSEVPMDTIKEGIDSEYPDFKLVLWGAMLPYINVMGNTFFIFVYLLPMVAIWIPQKKLIIPVGLTLIFSVVILGSIPEEFVQPAYLVILVTSVGILYRIYKSRR